MSKSQLRLERDADGSFTCQDDPGEVGYVAGAKRVSVTEQEAQLLRALGGCGYVLEIGTGLGVATRELEKTCCVYTVDNDPWVIEHVFPTLSASNCAASAGAFEDEYASWYFDMIFIDGHHDAIAIAADVALAKKHLANDGFLVFHDANYDHVREAFAKHGVIDVIIPTKHGLGIMWAKELF